LDLSGGIGMRWRALVLAGAVMLAAQGACVRADAQAPTPTVFFPLWSGALDEAALAVIHRAAEQARAAPGATLTVTAYADATGSVQANVYLSQLRAQRVVDELVAAGVAPGRIRMVAAGRQPQVGVFDRRVQIAFSR
jgi:outer membrane protein OmpA-like peptidoglycan-associated protein